jgi:putative ABC transport system permease protein
VSSIQPPRLSRAVIRWASPPTDRECILADFDEEFAARQRESGANAARAWFRRETLRSLVPLLVRRVVARNARRTRGDGMWTDALTDVRYAARLARRGPLHAAAVICTVALGVAATAAVFSVVNAVLLRPLPFAGSERVVRLGTVTPSGDTASNVAYPDFLDFRSGVPAFEAMSMFTRSSYTLQHGDTPREIPAIDVDSAFGTVFALHPMLGRAFAADEFRFGGPRAVILTYAFWQSEFGGDRALVGRTIVLSNETVQVVGVLPPVDFLFPNSDAAALAPLRINPRSFLVNRGALWADAAAKVRAGATIAEARTQLEAVGRRLQADFPQSNAQLGATFRPLHDDVVGPAGSMLTLLSLAIAAVLLIACLNVANLLLAKAHARGREFAVRAAIGGTSFRIRRQILGEGMLLACAGGALGIALAPVLTRGLVLLYPDGLPRAQEVGVDWRVIVVALAATVLAGALATLPLSRRAGRLDLADALRGGARGGTSRATHRVGSLVVVTQVATSVALLFASGLLMSTFTRLMRQTPGFVADGVLSFRLVAPAARLTTMDAVERYFDDVETRLKALAGVTGVATATQIPLGHASFGDVFVRQEKGDQGVNNPHAQIIRMSPGLLGVLGIPVLRGRGFTRADGASTPRVVLIDETLARQAYGTDNPVGRFIEWQGPKLMWQIVGVVGATRDQNLWESPAPHLFAPTPQLPGRSRYVVLKSTRGAGQLVGDIRAALREIDPSIPATDIATLEERMSAALASQRFRAAVVGALGASALLLAMLGIYGVMANAVGQRTKEIGIRMALGEGATGIRRRIVVDALRVTSTGAALGLAASLAVGRWLATFLYGVSPADPLFLAGATITLLLVSMLAAFGPAWRASRVDPVVALRAE